MLLVLMFMIVLGIDPGSHRVGYGIIEQSSAPRLVRCGLLEFSGDPLMNLGALYDGCVRLLDEAKPSVLALENLFFAKNTKTAAAVFQARGVIALAGVKRGIPIVEVTPVQVKQSVAGSGSATKTAVAAMAARLLGVKKFPGPDDVSDAVAIALTGGQIYKFTSTMNKNQ